MKFLVFLLILGIIITAHSEDKNTCVERVFSSDTLEQMFKWGDSIVNQCKVNLVPFNIKYLSNKKDLHNYWSYIIDSIPDSIFISPECRMVQIYITPFFQSSENQFKLFSYPNLRSVRIECVKPFNISPWFGSKCRADSLFFSDNTIDTLSDFLFENPNLKYLSWKHNNTRFYGECKNSEVNLKTLIYRGYFFNDIPNFLLKAHKLEELIFSFGMTTDYSKWSQVLKNNNKLTVLGFENSKLKYLSDEIFDLDLKYLGAYNCCLESIPPKIAKLKNLSSLSLDNNYLTSLPEEIKGLKDSLKELDLRDNFISKEEKERIKKWLPKTKIYFD